MASITVNSVAGVGDVRGGPAGALAGATRDRAGEPGTMTVRSSGGVLGGRAGRRGGTGRRVGRVGLVCSVIAVQVRVGGPES
ncbi:hypothetical protein O978_13725 [Mycobacterium avium subsp. paratuberculosis 10-5864]|nr:hypothetical protein O978_13725 [Mycobacterium avium subsp. paratuberculosis 10-5864]